jgi:hypothetical protein
MISSCSTLGNYALSKGVIVKRQLKKNLSPWWQEDTVVTVISIAVLIAMLIDHLRGIW